MLNDVHQQQTMAKQFRSLAHKMQSLYPRKLPIEIAKI
jgi:hypothetical protein